VVTLLTYRGKSCRFAMSFHQNAFQVSACPSLPHAFFFAPHSRRNAFSVEGEKC
jgi:hypothetical protein